MKIQLLVMYHNSQHTIIAYKLVESFALVFSVAVGNVVLSCVELLESFASPYPFSSFLFHVFL